MKKILPKNTKVQQGDHDQRIGHRTDLKVPQGDLAFEEELQRRQPISPGEYQEGDTLFMAIFQQTLTHDDSTYGTVELESVTGSYTWLLKKDGETRFRSLPIHGSIMKRHNPLTLEDDNSIIKCIIPDGTELTTVIRVSPNHAGPTHLESDDIRLPEEYLQEAGEHVLLQPRIKRNSSFYDYYPGMLQFRWYHKDQLIHTSETPGLHIDDLEFAKVGIYKLQIYHQKDLLWEGETRVVMKVKMKK